MFSLPKTEILRGRTYLDRLFSQGQWMQEPPFRAVFLLRSADDLPPIRVGFVVSKRVSKKAVERNRIRRMMREAYRLNKHEASSWLSQNQQGLDVFILYTGRTDIRYDRIARKIILLLHRLTQADAPNPG